VNLCAEVGEEALHEGAVEMPVAQDSAALHTDTALDQVDPSAALVAVGRQFRAAEELELFHDGNLKV
jgi:hypothetical protein